MAMTTPSASDSATSRQPYEVVGVAHDTKDAEGLTQSLIYIPFTALEFAHPPAGGVTVIVRSDAGSDALTGIRNEIGFLDPNLNMLEVKTLAAYLDQSRATLLFAVQTYGAIGFGLILAAIGLAGVTAYAAQRRKQIAIRMAVGASSGRVLREGAALVIIGGIIGYLGAIALAKILGSLASMFVALRCYSRPSPRGLLLARAPLHWHRPPRRSPRRVIRAHTAPILAAPSSKPRNNLPPIYPATRENIQGATECSTAHNVLKICAPPSVSANCSK